MFATTLSISHKLNLAQTVLFYSKEDFEVLNYLSSIQSLVITVFEKPNHIEVRFDDSTLTCILKDKNISESFLFFDEDKTLLSYKNILNTNDNYSQLTSTTWFNSQKNVLIEINNVTSVGYNLRFVNMNNVFTKKNHFSN